MNSNEMPRVTPEVIDNSIKDIINYIQEGNEILDRDADEFSEDAQLEYINSIILKPTYQREYRFSIADESLLIESILVGIPIPPVFLCTTRFKGIKVRDVVDGQHRLKAFYRFRKNEFRLTKLPILTELEGKCFDELPQEKKEELLSYKVSTYVFENFPGKKFELEVFKRYNKGTNTLTAQEMRNAVYSSPYNERVSKFAEKLYHDSDNAISKIYNVTKDRYLKKTVHEGIFIVLYVLEYGICKSLKNSTDYAEKYMREKSEFADQCYRNGQETKLKKDIKNVFDRFDKFNDWLQRWQNITPYPLSKEIYGVSSKSYKFQTSMALIIPAIYKKIYIDNYEKYKSVEFSSIQSAVRNALENSFLENPTYTASSTNSREIEKFIDNFYL